ncbi:glycosyltransferase [Pseudobutyrivibrio xylanivorans]|uniref:Glycosyltransferase involved in cell wall bisynthesis n=1 Tax=Pseudobutyrivibrio xylanivorans DSM 14809 TaxID=1123012 RepID=A0A1M6IK11_PSEXY|nr:glycosyltransferase [Pseudobutyrivibrio xylanivorans]SHJ34778.1 Glycosyltransferase involved in cell wall bisynthesis [Pseudobutyrivibrio xylanivorans DSM 14809]
MKKKLLVTNDILLGGGGVEKLMYDLVWAWHEKYDITIMTFDYDKRFYEYYPKDVKYLSLSKGIIKPNAERGFWFWIRKPYRAIVELMVNAMRFDVLLCMKDGWPLWRGVRYKIPVKFAWHHTDYNNYHSSNYIFGNEENEVKAMQQYDNIICVAQNVKKGICDVIGDPGNLVVKYNPINVDIVLKKSKEQVTDIESMKLPEKDRPVRFVSVGRLNMQKGYTLLIEAAKKLEDEGYKFEIIVVGAKEKWGDEYEKIQIALKETGVKSCKFIGGRSNPYKYMAIADWFISSSIFEGYSLVSQEAAILDIPMLLTDCSGVRELLGDSEYGIVMPIDVDGIYNNMRRVLENPELRSYYKNKISERKEIIDFYKRAAEIEKLFS